jgi:hypothetical protein
MHGETPYIVRGLESDQRRLFFSRPEQALILPVSLSPGHGILRAGTLLSINVSAAGNVGYYVPYAPTTVAKASMIQASALSFLVGDQTAATSVYISLEDSYRFKVGDDVILYDTNTQTTAAENLGAISAIDRTTYAHQAVLTVTATPSGATFTFAQGAAIHVEQGADNTNGWSDCAGILTTSVDTGKGENAKGALGAMVVSNAVLYKGMLFNYDAAALADLGGSVLGQFLILK